MTLLDRQLNILWIMIQATDNDEVLEPPGDKQLAVVEKPKVACSQKCRLARLMLGCMKRVLIFFIMIPVALRHTGPMHPDLAHLVRHTARQKLRMHNHDFFVGKNGATAHDSACFSIITVCHNDPMVFECSRLKASLNRERRRFAPA